MSSGGKQWGGRRRDVGRNIDQDIEYLTKNNT